MASRSTSHGSRPTLREVAVTLEVLEPPSVDRLYFWAIQASFLDGAGSHGAGHLGLQWNPQIPRPQGRQLGGYATRGAILSGSRSPLPSTPQDTNTRDFPWLVGRMYACGSTPHRRWAGGVRSPISTQV